MSEMVERVAGAILGAVFGKDVPLELSAEELAENAARAAIEAMRRSSPAMIAAAWTVFDRYPHKRLGPGPGFKEAIAAAFDAALKE